MYTELVVMPLDATSPAMDCKAASKALLDDNNPQSAAAVWEHQGAHVHDVAEAALGHAWKQAKHQAQSPK
eukprot:CAMPEP_0115457930 /NCGR_PEP_ID=MMETSP0271-20121206/45471_1 /TAXON_ID=71861 /ORGANISM="Scrippsiella trochoidea, Strain CCMP3099" /LENGTH=69 /DNA_ID=CAMNT_0002884519 /DNA_START=217 /DNA_END=425 /DNA_ORIENTATION=+